MLVHKVYNLEDRNLLNPFYRFCTYYSFGNLTGIG